MYKPLQGVIENQHKLS